MLVGLPREKKHEVKQRLARGPYFLLPPNHDKAALPVGEQVQSEQGEVSPGASQET